MSMKPLMDGFNTNDLLFRKTQLESIEKVFERYRAEDPIATNLILIGVTGAGKTFTMEKVMAQYPEHIYISAATRKRSNQIISLISSVNVRKTDILLEQTIKFLKKEKKVLIIDELNRVEDPKDLFGDLNTIFRETGIPIILITNNPLIVNSMEEDAKNTLFLKRVIFARYNALELRDLCLQRLRELPEDLSRKMEDGTLRFICATAARSGSARKALNLLRGCYTDDKFSLDHVGILMDQEECIDFETFIQSMNETQRIFLRDLKEQYDLKLRRGEEDFLTSQDIQNARPDLHKSKISQLITEMEEKYCLIKTEWVEKGRGGGRYRKISFSNQEVLDKLEEVFPA